jgi:hypothetical protein
MHDVELPARQSAPYRLHGRGIMPSAHRNLRDARRLFGQIHR